MGRDERLALLNRIQELRHSNVISYITGDRENVSTRIAPDIIRVFFRHLEALGSSERIDLFLYTRGGDVLTPWRLVNLIREYTSSFSILVPFRAYSAGTLIALGANEIVMGKMGELGPIDPSVANAFNPQDPNNPIAKIPVSVEDVSSFITLAMEIGQLKGQEQLETVFSHLADKVHPLALGNVQRNYALIRSIARKLLRLHMSADDDDLIKDIINNLTEKLYAHNHMISRREARQDIKLTVTQPSTELEQLMWNLYEEYERELNLLEPFDPSKLIQDSQQKFEFEVSGGIIESLPALDNFIFTGTAVATDIAPDGTPNVNVSITSQRWKKTI
jgi:primosomal protein N''